MTEHLQLNDVSVHYGEVRAVAGASLALAPAEIGCLLGPSGCGKTSLLRAIAGFEPISAGSISLRGRQLSSVAGVIAPEQRRVGMVFQDFALFPHLKVGRNIAFGLSALARSERQARVAELLELVELQAFAEAYPHELSGGQQQRVALARALAPRPDLLLLDEPFSSLDTALREQLAVDIRALLKQTGTTAILVTHDRREALAMADQVAEMESGRIVRVGSTAEVLQQPASEYTLELPDGRQVHCQLPPGVELPQQASLSVRLRRASSETPELP